MAEQSRVDERILRTDQVQKMASILEVTDPGQQEQLGESVQAALLSYSAQLKYPPSKPKQLHESFDTLYESSRRVRTGLQELSPAERDTIDQASEFPRPLNAAGGPPSTDQALNAIDRIMLSLRLAIGALPPIRKGRPRDSARRLFVHRLACIYARSRGQLDGGDLDQFELPTRGHDAYSGHDTGRFRDFVLAVIEASEHSEARKGIDDVIRSVCEKMGKKESREP